MSDIPLQLTIAVFQGETRATEALQEVQAATHATSAEFHGAIVVHKDDHGKLHYKDVGMTPAKGTAAGAILGGVLGILTGGAGLALGALGGLIGGLVTRRRREQELPTLRINQVAASLKPGCSAVIAVVTEGGTAELERMLKRLGGDVHSIAVAEDMM